MVATTPPVQPAIPQQTLQIEAKNLSGLPPPALNIGDVVQLIVRQNSPQELGLVALKGLLIKANLPPNLAQGDRVNAQLVQNGDKVIFKIIGDILGVNTEVATTPAPSLTRLENLKTEFEEIFQAASATNLKSIKTESLADTIRSAGILRGSIERLLTNLSKLLPEGEKLFTPQELIRELSRASTGTQAKALLQVAESIRQFVNEHSPTPERVELQRVQDELSKMVLSSALNNIDTSKQLQTLIGDLERTLKTPPKANSRTEQEILRTALRDLRLVQEENNSPQQTKLALPPTLEGALTSLQSQILRAASTVGALDQRTVAELTRLAGQLDQLAGTQEALERLNPLLQALGEPAMILFPFLFQGLLSHTEITVYSRPKRKGDSDEVDEDGNGGQGATQENFRRIQVSAPLPNLGVIDVDVAVRSKHILVSLNVQDDDTAEFLKSKLEELGALLKDQGYARAELFTHVGEKKEVTPEWALSLHALKSLVA